jgi:hypothetical protein
MERIHYDISVRLVYRHWRYQEGTKHDKEGHEVKKVTARSAPFLFPSSLTLMPSW